ncbi:MAG: XisI protein [Candidatus Promineifilaceae bacterium]
MDKLSHYRNLIKNLLTQYAELINQSAATPEIMTELVVDEERDQYLLVNTGWLKRQRMRGTTVYLRLRNGKIWVEEDWLENGIVKDLLEAGVPKEDIVLAFQPPEMRPHTDFAVA